MTRQTRRDPDGARGEPRARRPANPARSVANRIFLTIAGRRLRAYSIVKHRGRRSGREYRNPVSAYPYGDGFVVPILYGTGSQWVRNAVATGGFVLRTKGRDIPLYRPEIIPVELVRSALPPVARLLAGVQRTRRFVWGHRTAGGAEGPPARA